MIIYKSSLNGIIFEFAFTGNIENINHAVIMCDGLPSIPKQKNFIKTIANKGVLVIYPRYRGTWESEGNFLKNSPVSDIKEIVEFIKGGCKITELYNLKEFNFNIEKISVAGVSFGGAVSLALASMEEVNHIYAYSPILNFSSFSDEKYNCQDLSFLGDFIQRAFPFVYRFNKDDWSKMIKGGLFEPLSLINEIDFKKITVIYGKDDNVIDYRYITDSLKGKNIDFALLDNEGHFSFESLLDDFLLRL